MGFKRRILPHIPLYYYNRPSCRYSSISTARHSPHYYHCSQQHHHHLRLQQVKELQHFFLYNQHRSVLSLPCYHSNGTRRLMVVDGVAAAECVWPTEINYREYAF